MITNNYSCDMISRIVCNSRELSIHHKLRHPNVVMLIGYIREPHFSLVTEFMPRGSLFDIIYSHQHSSFLSEFLTLFRISFDVAKGLSYLHFCNIIHRDLKPGNILIDINWCAKLADFGISRLDDKNMTRTILGTVSYLAPEVIRDCTFSFSSDIFSYGVVLCELVSQESPFPETGWASEITDKILEGERPSIPQACFPIFRLLIEKCWHQNSAERPTIQDIIRYFQQSDSTNSSFESIKLGQEQEITELFNPP